jgi:hypothetical protein
MVSSGDTASGLQEISRTNIRRIVVKQKRMYNPEAKHERVALSGIVISHLHDLNDRLGNSGKRSRIVNRLLKGAYDLDRELRKSV